MTNTLFNQTPLTAVLAGASGAIGGAMLKHLLIMSNVQQIYVIGRRAQAFNDSRIIAILCDVTKETDLAALNARLKSDNASVNLVINATGLLHDDDIKPEKALAQLKLSALQLSFAVNAFAPVLLLQAILPNLTKQSSAWVVNLSARVGSIGDNRLGGWYSYRAAKAAQNQLFKTAAIELARSHPLATCLQLHPGTVNSSLSKPFQSTVKAGGLFTPEYSAACLLNVINTKSVADTGTFWDWDNTSIPW
jgi:NAD(P)-dependent dehydrogenase (short-subunit alcohol dehydrogenase family)